MPADLAARPARAPILGWPTAGDAASWGPWIGAILAIGLSVAALAQLSHASTAALAMVRRLSPAVWIAFAAGYLIQPIADLVIFRRVWRLPLSAFGVMLRKVVINETLFGYTGELYFYLWAKRRPELSQAPFGAIKDVNVISALAANVLTLVLLPVSASGLERLSLHPRFGFALWSGLGFVALTFSALLFARRLFSLGRRDLVFVTVVHALRLAATTGLTLLVWRLALPEVAMGLWLVLLASRLLLARLPFLANKDLVFANLMLVLFGAGSPTALLLATLALATLAAHVAVMALVGSQDLLGVVRRLVRP